MTLGPLAQREDGLEVVREWSVDQLVPLLERDQELEKALDGMDYARDIRPRIFVPPNWSTVSDGHQVLLFLNQKGGAGKTTSALEVACALVAMGYTVRLIDADPQDASLTSWLRPAWDDTPEAERFDLADVMAGTQPLDEATYETVVRGLYLVPSGQSLSRIEYDPQAGRDGTLRAAIRRSKAPVDLTVIDAPPALGKLSVNGLLAATKLIVPLKVGALDTKALAHLHTTIRAVQEDSNPDLEVAATVMTAWDKSRYAAKVAARLRRDYPEAIVSTARRSVRVAEAADSGLPVRAYAPTCTTTGDYDQLARLLMAEKRETTA